MAQPPPSSHLSALRVRASAARELIRRAEVEPAVGLSYVVWPTVELETASSAERPPLSGERGERGAELVLEEGLSWAEAAARVGCAKATVGRVVMRAREANDS